MPLIWRSNTIPIAWVAIIRFHKNKSCISLLKVKWGKTIQIHLQNSEVFKNAIHHVFFRQMLEFVDKVDHVFAHRRAVDPINAFSSFQAGILCLRDTHNPQRCLQWKWCIAHFWGANADSAALTSTFSTTCLPKEQTLVETVIVMFSWLLYWLLTP